VALAEGTSHGFGLDDIVVHLCAGVRHLYGESATY
jgi:hypothetical protein